MVVGVYIYIQPYHSNHLKNQPALLNPNIAIGVRPPSSFPVVTLTVSVCSTREGEYKAEFLIVKNLGTLFPKFVSL